MFWYYILDAAMGLPQKHFVLNRAYAENATDVSHNSRLCIF